MGRRMIGGHLIDAEFGDLPSDAAEQELEDRARSEKAAALAELYTAPLSLLLGPGGTGKTRLLQILCRLPEIVGDGITLLAPTGKARVQMQVHSKALKAYTVAQFLQPERYDWETQRYHLSDAPRKEAGKTLIIDEASMLTEDQLAAVLQHVMSPRRLILVGDHRQLPPLGAGRPLVDIARELAPEGIAERFPRVAKGYAELTVHRRQSASGKDESGKLKLRDDVLLASWFTGGPGTRCGRDLGAAR